MSPPVVCCMLLQQIAAHLQARSFVMATRYALVLGSYLSCVITGQQLQQLNAGIGDLSLRLLQQNVKGDTNSIHSPYSIASALGMCILGAEDETFESMQLTMGITLVKEKIKEAFKESSTHFLRIETDPENGFVVKAANRLYVNKDYQLGNVYRREVNEIFHADAQNVDFAEKRDQVQKSINSFVKERTQGLISDILSSPLPSDTVMALVNALYFKGVWQNEMTEPKLKIQFNAHNCSSEGAIPKPQTVTWIQTEHGFNYTDSSQLQATLVEIPYIPNENSRDRASMLIMLPWDEHKCDMPRWVKQKLKWSTLVEAVKLMSLRKIEVTMPKFEVESQFELSPVLSRLGMETAFSNSANFNGMVDAGKANIKIDKVIHKAKMNVDKKGTEAAAATVLSMTPLALNTQPSTKIAVDRSFVAMIIVRQSGNSFVPLFTSVINKV